MTTTIRRLAVASVALAAIYVASLVPAGAGTTTGPNGEIAVPASSVTLTPEEEAKIKKGKYTAGLAHAVGLHRGCRSRRP